MDSKFEQYMREAWGKIYASGQSWDANDADSPPAKYAAEFFDYFKAHPTSQTGIKAAQQAFMFWSNLGSTEEIEKALPYIAEDSKAWRACVLLMGNAYGRSGRREGYKSLIKKLSQEVTHPGSLSQIKLILADLSGAEEESARALYQKVIELDAHPFDIAKAKGALHEMDALQIGAIAPPLSLTTIDGASIELVELSGKVVLIEFWAMSCGPCLPDIPHLNRLYKKLPSSEFQLIGITDSPDLAALRAFLKKQGMDWPQVLEPIKREKENILLGQARSKYNVYGIPRSFVIDRLGKLVAKNLRGEELVAATIKEVENAQ